MWLINSKYWGLHAKRYSLRHACNPAHQPRGCVIAAQLRAISALLDALPLETVVDLQVTYDAEPLLLQWLGGDPTPPPWYTLQNGTIPQLAQRLGKMPEGRITVTPVERNTTPLTAAAYELADTARRTYDQICSGKSTNNFESEVALILEALDA